MATKRFTESEGYVRLYAAMASLRFDVASVRLWREHEAWWVEIEGGDCGTIDRELVAAICNDGPDGETVLVRGALDAQASAERRMYGWKVRAEHAEGTVERVWRALGSLSRGKL